MKKIILGSAAGLIVTLTTAAAFADQHGGRGFDRMDKNGDGKITAEEMSDMHADMMAEADANGDGAITREEMKAFHEARREEWRKDHNPDTNGDGVVSKDEFVAAAAERFDKMDKNGDGVLSDDEKPHRRGRHHRGE